MKKTLLGIFATLVLFISTTSEAQDYFDPDGIFGVGLSLGIRKGSGISFYADINSYSFAQGMIGFDTFNGGIDLSAEFAMFLPIRFVQQPNLRFYYGIGATLVKDACFKLIGDKKLKKDAYAGAKMPIGALFTLREIPLQLYFELSPGTILYDKVRPFIHTFLGARYYFN